MIGFHVDGIPKAQPRPRAWARKMLVGGEEKVVARMFDAGTAEGWKGLVAVAAKPHCPLEPYRGAVAVELDFDLPRPKRLCRRQDFQGPIWCTGRPDCDNLAKAVLDCLTQQGWWADDAQVVRLNLEKHYHSVSGRPGVSVRVQWLSTFASIGHHVPVESYTP